MDPVLDSGRPRSRHAAGGGVVLDRFRALARLLLRRGRLDQDTDDEMRFHIDQYERDLIRSGVTPDEAATRARNEFGNIGFTKEACREAAGLRLFDEFLRNAGYAFRQLRRSPGFGVAVV